MRAFSVKTSGDFPKEKENKNDKKENGVQIR